MTYSPQFMNLIGPAFFIAYFLFVVGVLIFVLMLLYRFVKAHEQISRHMYEIACDFRVVADDIANRNK